MGLFICEKCQSVENTALGRWWSRADKYIWGETAGTALCSACTPAQFADGSPSRGGRWHGEFPRRRATAADVRSVYNPKAFVPEVPDAS
jgi:hypothetical protein